MKTYKTFEEYMYDNYYNLIFNKVKSFLFQKKNTSFLSSGNVTDVSRFEMEDFHIEGATFNSTDKNILDFRLTLTVDVSIFGKSRYDYESESKSVWVSVYFTSLLENGLHNVKIKNVDEYSRERFKKESKLDHFLVPYLYSEDADDVAENFLKDYYPAALNSPMPLPIHEIVCSLGLKMYYAPLDSTTFGRTYFDVATVTVYTDLQLRATAEITISAGTLLINPDVYFMRNIGSVNNTIIHECVHWERHRMFFELKKLLNQDYSCISCEIVESYGDEKSEPSPLDWIEWQANTLAPKILLPATTTKKYIKDRLYDLRQSALSDVRDAEIMAQAIQETADFFKVSRIAAKLRAIELGFEQAHGVYVYIEGRKLPHFSFATKVIGKNGSFVIDTISAVCTLMVKPLLKQLYQEEKIVFVNNMFCINTPKYVFISDDGHRQMTEYALEHIDECCFLFTVKSHISHYYDDFYYHACFLCREYTSDPVNEAQLSDEERNKTLQSLLENMEAIKSDNEKVNSVFAELPGTFQATLKYHMNRLGFTNESLAEATQLTPQTISVWKNHPYDKNNGIETLLKIFVGMHLAPDYCFDMMKKAGVSFNMDNPKESFLHMLVRDQTRLNLSDWQDILNNAGINVKLYNKNKM